MKIRLVEFDRTGAWTPEQLAWLDSHANTVFEATRGDDGYWRADGESDAPVILVDDEVEECADCADCAGCAERAGSNGAGQE